MPLKATLKDFARYQANVQPDDVQPDNADPRPPKRRRDARADARRALEGATGLRRRMLERAIARMEEEADATTRP